ncbi:MAG: hypothetical protein IJX32_01450, partial [Spirochaetaceae bacterium]|nr:hypothetical protein [Spirochaetaceae bacterium]
KAGKLYEGKETIFFDKTQIAASLAICLILPLLPKERPKGIPLWKPQTYEIIKILSFLDLFARTKLTDLSLKVIQSLN